MPPMILTYSRAPGVELLHTALCYTTTCMESRKQPLRILALTHCPPEEPCTFARIYTPLRALEAMGEVEYTLEPIWPWRAAAFQRLLRDLPNWDIVWVARPRHYLMLPLMREARRVGTPVLVDIDDWLLEEPDSFDALQWVGTRTSQDTTRRSILAADAVTASTPIIAERCAALGVRAHVVPNAVDCRQFTRLSRDHGILTIAFCGTIAHRDDVPLIAPALRQLLHTHAGQVRVVTVACPIPDLQGMDAYTHHAFVPATDYPRLLSELRIDIGLAPLYDTSFNRARSDIKYLEYSATGAATIASPVVAYRDTVQEDRGVLVHENTAEAWAEAILRLVDDAPLQRRRANNAYEWVRGERSIEATAHTWLALFRHYADEFGTRGRSKIGQDDPGRLERVLEHIILRQAPYYGGALPSLLARRLLHKVRERAAGD
jgi:glycosyltransferase involved in cell wall biosynthesis